MIMKILKTLEKSDWLYLGAALLTIIITLVAWDYIILRNVIDN